MASCDRTWRIVKPDGIDNEVLNPSAETTGNFAAVGGAVVARSTTYQKYGFYSYSVTTAANADGISFTTTTLTNADHYVTMRIRGRLPANLRVRFGALNWYILTKIESIDEYWNLWGVAIPAADASGTTSLQLHQWGAGTGAFYVDGIQVEANETWTTYCDGTQPGCQWNGTAHASQSSRSPQARAGGLVQDLWDKYGFFAEQIVGAGATEELIASRPYAVLPGSELSGNRTIERQFSLIGRFIGHSEADLHQKRQDLLKVLSIGSYAESQPLVLNFNGAAVQKQIAVFFAGGLEGNLNVSYGSFQVEGDDEWLVLSHWTEKVALQFRALDPFWYEIGESAQVLDTNDSATFTVVAGRLRDIGQWDNMGPPNAAGSYTSVLAIAEDATYIYFGGNFQNFNNIANADYIVRWHKVNQTYSALSSGMNNVVRALAIAPDGDLYAAGDFTTAGGAARNRIASWDGTTWSALGTGLNAEGRCLAIGQNGWVYVGGDFTTAGGAAALRVAAWNIVGAAWNTLGAGTDGDVYSVTVGVDGTIYWGGNFANAGGAGAAYIASWSGSAWSPLGSGMNGIVYGLAVDGRNTLYAAGAFTTAGGSTVDYIARWNGTSWNDMNQGFDGTAWAVDVGPNNILYAVGEFTQPRAASDVAEYVARWSGATWFHVDINFPASIAVKAVLASQYTDPVVVHNYDVFLGWDDDDTCYYGGLVAVTNDGTTPAYPRVSFIRIGGTLATIKTLRNETTGKEMLFDYDLSDGETLTIDLAPARKSVTSSIFGNRFDAVLPNSNFGSWTLQPESNNVTAFVDVTGAPTVTACLLWKDTYKSFD